MRARVAHDRTSSFLRVSGLFLEHRRGLCRGDSGVTVRRSRPVSHSMDVTFKSALSPAGGAAKGDR